MVQMLQKAHINTYDSKRYKMGGRNGAAVPSCPNHFSSVALPFGRAFLLCLFSVVDSTTCFYLVSPGSNPGRGLTIKSR
jgi:hypothetical protein